MAETRTWKHIDDSVDVRRYFWRLWTAPPLVKLKIWPVPVDSKKPQLKARTDRRNWTELTRLSFWRTDQWASSHALQYVRITASVVFVTTLTYASTNDQWVHPACPWLIIVFSSHCTFCVFQHLYKFFYALEFHVLMIVLSARSSVYPCVCRSIDAIIAQSFYFTVFFVILYYY